MPSSIGELSDRWSLSQAVDALSAAAKQGGRPGWIWVAGFFYPAVSLAPGLSYEQILGGSDGGIGSYGWSERSAEMGASMFLFLLLLPLLARLWVGLARTASPSVWSVSLQREGRGNRSTPQLRSVWRAGRGLTISTAGLWLQVTLLSIAALVCLGLIPVGLFFFLVEEVSEVFGVLLIALLPIVAFLLFYLLLLNLLFQIALHSLAQNRRGAASALTHAWRIAKNDPWATARATLVDFLLYATVLLIAFSLSAVLVMTCLIPVAMALLLATSGFLGVTRACYWARAYRALGGLSPEDQIPGLQDAAVEPEPA